MTLIVPPGFGLAAMTYTGAVGTQPYVTTLGVTLNLGLGTAVEAADLMFDNWAEHIMPETTNLLTLDRVQLYIGDDGPSGSVDSTRTPVAGSATSTHPPTALSAIVRKVTSGFGRRGRGRMFVPGVINEAQVDQDGSVVAARRTSLDLAFSNLLADLSPITGIIGDPVLLHSTAPADPDLIEAFTTSDLVGWIRGRIR